MFEWLRGFKNWLQAFIVGVPLYIAGPAMILIGTLDSSLLSLPELNDYLVVARCYAHPRTVFIFPLFAAIGSVIGCTLLYTIVQRGGRPLLHRRFRAEHIERVERAYARFGIFALAVPALWPPPMPFKIFVATAGALGFPRRRFILTILIARSVRYYTEGVLAVLYGRRVLRFMEENGLLMLSLLGAILVIALVVYLFKRRRAEKKAAAS